MLGVFMLLMALFCPVVAIVFLAHSAGMKEVFYLYFTNKWYGAVVKAMGQGSRLLDIGAGITFIRSGGEWLTGWNTPRKFHTLIGTIRLLLAQEVAMVGLCDEPEQFKKAAGNMVRAQLKHTVILHNKSIYETQSLKQVFIGTNRFNAIVFSDPLMGQKDPLAALKGAEALLKDGGVVYVPQVYSAKPSSAFKILAPLFKYLNIYPVEDVQNLADEAGMDVTDDMPADGTDDKNHEAARILVLSKRIAGVAADSSVRARKKVESETPL